MHIIKEISVLLYTSLQAKQFDRVNMAAKNGYK